MRKLFIMTLFLVFVAPFVALDAQTESSCGFNAGSKTQNNINIVLGQSFGSIAVQNGLEISEGVAQAQLVTETLSDETCVNEPYAENGFDIPVSDLTEGTTAYDSYDHSATTGYDSLTILELTVWPVYAESTSEVFHDDLPLIDAADVSYTFPYAPEEVQARVTKVVPTIVDVKTKKVVNNDYHRLTNYWETVWKPFHKEGAPDLYPEDLRSEIDALNEIIFNEINNGVYKAGFAQSQESYEENYHLVFNRLDRLEEHLSKNRFLFGDRLTDADIRLYVTLATFDTAYYFAFRLNKKRIRDYDNLWNYAKELYSIPAFKEATDFDSIKRGYLLGSHADNPYQILPLGPDNTVWEEPNNRTEKFGALKYRYV